MALHLMYSQCEVAGDGSLAGRPLQRVGAERPPA